MRELRRQRARRARRGVSRQHRLTQAKLAGASLASRRAARRAFACATRATKAQQNGGANGRAKAALERGPSLLAVRGAAAFGALQAAAAAAGLRDWQVRRAAAPAQPTERCAALPINIFVHLLCSATQQLRAHTRSQIRRLRFAYGKVVGKTNVPSSALRSSKSERLAFARAAKSKAPVLETSQDKNASPLSFVAKTRLLLLVPGYERASAKNTHLGKIYWRDCLFRTREAPTTQPLPSSRARG